MQNQLDVVCDVSRRLGGLGVPYMLTGSVAMNYYAEPRMTRDVDLVLDLRPENVGPLVEGFAGDYYVDADAVGEAVSGSSLFNMIPLESIVKVDCVILKPTEYRQHEFGRRRAVDIRGVRTHIASREDLILSKLYWALGSHSEMQLRDVANLMRGEYDAEYVDTWAETLGVGGLLKELGRG